MIWNILNSSMEVTSTIVQWICMKSWKKANFSSFIEDDKYFEIIGDHNHNDIAGAFLYFNNIKDIFLLKFIDPKMKIYKIKHFPFEGTKPLTYME